MFSVPSFDRRAPPHKCPVPHTALGSAPVPVQPGPAPFLHPTGHHLGPAPQLHVPPGETRPSCPCLVGPSQPLPTPGGQRPSLPFPHPLPLPVFFSLITGRPGGGRHPTTCLCHHQACRQRTCVLSPDFRLPSGRPSPSVLPGD